MATSKQSHAIIRERILTELIGTTAGFGDASSRTDMIEALNYYGRRRIPFLFIIDFDVNHLYCIPLRDIRSDEILYSINGFTNSCSVPMHRHIVLTRHPVPYDEYLEAFRRVIAQLRNGNSYLLNLTFPTPMTINVTLKDLFYNSRARYKLWLKDTFVVFSPETFIQIKGRTIAAFPMKGTIDASIENARDKILRDEKERAEHVTIVDLIRNDLGMVASNITVRRFRYVETIRTNQKDLLQVSSEITGGLGAGYHERIGDLLLTMLPAGSVTGAPKRKTVEIIRSVENYTRGYYTGIFGYFDGYNLDSGVMIRFIENNHGNYWYKSGGGITVYSDPRKEYEELIDKIYVPVI